MSGFYFLLKQIKQRARGLFIQPRTDLTQTEKEREKNEENICLQKETGSLLLIS